MESVKGIRNLKKKEKKKKKYIGLNFHETP